MCWSLCIEPINEWGGSMGPDEGWQCNSISAQKKGAAVFRYQLCIFVCGHFQHVQFFIMFLFICDVYVTNAFRTSVYGTFICELPTMGSCAVSSLLPFMALLLTLMVLFYVKGNKRFFTQRGDNSLFPESKKCVCLNAG